VRSMVIRMTYRVTSGRVRFFAVSSGEHHSSHTVIVVSISNAVWLMSSLRPLKIGSSPHDELRNSLRPRRARRKVVSLLEQRQAFLQHLQPYRKRYKQQHRSTSRRRTAFLSSKSFSVISVLTEPICWQSGNFVILSVSDEL
jgi:hypothetical protein